jgi:hypothetical protein
MGILAIEQLTSASLKTLKALPKDQKKLDELNELQNKAAAAEKTTKTNLDQASVDVTAAEKDFDTSSEAAKDVDDLEKKQDGFDDAKKTSKQAVADTKEMEKIGDAVITAGNMFAVFDSAKVANVVDSTAPAFYFI